MAELKEQWGFSAFWTPFGALIVQLLPRVLAARTSNQVFQLSLPLSPPLSLSLSLSGRQQSFFVKQPAVPLLFNMRGETARHALVSRARETSGEHGEKELGGNKKHTVHQNCVGVTENLPGKNLTVEPEQSRNNGGVMRSGHSLDEE